MDVKGIGQEVKQWVTEAWESITGKLGSHSVEKKNSSHIGDKFFQFLKDPTHPLSPEDIEDLQDKFTVKDKASSESMDKEAQMRFLNNLPEHTKFDFTKLSMQEKKEFLELIDKTFPKIDVMSAALFIDPALDYNPYLNMLAFRSKLQN